MPTISQRKFADLVGFSEATIRKAIEKGYIQQGSITDENGKKAIDYDVAIVEWNNSPAGLKSAGKGTKALEDLPKKGVKDSEKKASGHTYKAPPVDPEAQKKKSEIIDLKLDSEKLRKARDQFEFQKQIGNFVNKQATDAALFDFGKLLRENILNMPPRYTVLIRNAASDSAGEDIFMEACEEALRALSTPPDLTKY